MVKTHPTMPSMVLWELTRERTRADIAAVSPRSTSRARNGLSRRMDVVVQRSFRRRVVERSLDLDRGDRSGGCQV